VFTDPVRPANMARFLFLNQRAGDFFGDWERIANDAVAILRCRRRTRPYDRNLSDLIGELSTRSEESESAGLPTTSSSTAPRQDVAHPLVGVLTLSYEALELPEMEGKGSSSTPPNRTRRHKKR